MPVSYFESFARGGVLRPIENLPAALLVDFPGPTLSPKLTFAIDLYNTCAFELDTEVRFLALVTVLEVLAERKRQTGPVVQFLAACHQLLNTSSVPDQDDLDALASGLRNLGMQSISRACQDLVADAGGDVKLFKRAYKARSELLHDGIARTDPELPRQPHVVDDLVQRVLLAQVARASMALNNAPKNG